MQTKFFNIRFAFAAALVSFAAVGAWALAGGVRTPFEPLDPTDEIRVTKGIPLYDDPTFTGLNVAPPLQFLQREKATGSVQANISVNFLPAGATQYGDLCETWNTQAQAAFSFAASIWASLIQSPVAIVVNACWTTLGPNILGSAGPERFHRNFANAPLTGTFYPVALASALAGSDLNGAAPEIQANFASTFNWYFGTDRNAPLGTKDFVSVVLHELGHGLGFLGTMDVASGQGSWGLGTPTVSPSIYDRFTVNGSGQALLNTALFANPSAALAAQLQSNNIVFTATQANAANGGVPVPLYTPATWNDGSSYSHLAESFNGTANALMTFRCRATRRSTTPGRSRSACSGTWAGCSTPARPPATRRSRSRNRAAAPERCCRARSG